MSLLTIKKKKEDYSKGRKPLGCRASSNGLRPAGQNTGQREEPPGGKAPALQCILPKSRTPDYKVTDLQNSQCIFFLHVIWWIQSQAWKLRRVPMRIFPAEVSLKGNKKKTKHKTKTTEKAKPKQQQQQRTKRKPKQFKKIEKKRGREEKASG